MNSFFSCFFHTSPRKDLAKGSRETIQRRKLPKLSFGVSKEREYFLDNLSLLVDSGMGLPQALQTIYQEISSPSLRRVIASIGQDIDDGYMLAESLKRHRMLSGHLWALVDIGERSGRLGENLKMLVLQEQKTRLFRQKIHSAMMYPVFLLGFTLLVGIVISWVILPKLSTVFGQLNIELPLISQIFIGFGVFMTQWGSLVVPVFVFVLGVSFYLLFFAPHTKHIGQGFLLSIPTVRSLIINIELALFGFIVGTLLRSGIGIVEALKAIASSTDIRHYQQLYGHLALAIDEGRGFHEGISLFPDHATYLPIHIQEMIISAERSGNLAETFLRIGNHFEEKVDINTKNMTTLLEPLLLIIVWFGVVGVALAVILPIYSLIGGMSDVGVSTAPRVASPSFQRNLSTTSVSEDVLPVQTAFAQLKSGNLSLSVRALPSDFSKTLGSVQPHQAYQIIETKNDWFLLQIDHNRRGWIHKKYLQYP